MIFTQSISGVLVLATDVPSDATKDLQRQIRSFRSLEAGWCYGRGENFSEEVINRSMMISAMFGAFGWDTEAYPGPDGEIAISGRLDETTLRVTVESGEPLTVEMKLGTEITPELPINDEEFYYQISLLTSRWNTFGSYIQAGGVHATTHGIILHSSPQVRTAEEEYPLLKSNVQRPEAEASAHIWPIAVPRGSDRLTYFGDSTETSFQAIN